MVSDFKRVENIVRKGKKMQVTCIFFPFFNVCKSPLLQGYSGSGFCAMRLTHYQMTNFRLFQTERVCRRQFQIGQKWQKVFQTGKKHCEKRRNCLLQAISPFPTVFSKGLFPRGIKRCHYVGMG